MSAFGAGGHGLESGGLTIPNVEKMVLYSSSFADACIKRGCARKIEYLLNILLCRRIARELGYYPGGVDLSRLCYTPGTRTISFT